MNEEKMIKVLEDQITKLQQIQEDYSANTNLVIETSNCIRAHVDLIRYINTKFKQW